MADGQKGEKMILSYRDWGEGKRRKVKARITTDHPPSLYGQPVIVLEDGNVIDLGSWTALEYWVIRAGKKEMAQLVQMGLV
jgi:hypothetical protein